jgi:ribosomal protein S18 acetylase RimI-like enzyme
LTRRQSEDVRLRGLQADDIPALVDILERCEVFRPDEVDVGREVLEAAAKQGSDGDYRVVVAEQSGQAVGWVCYGLVPLTDATYDLYWIAVDPRMHSTGVGRLLVDKVHQTLTVAGARWLLAETSTAEAYENTRQFYLRTGFELLSSIPDFYRAGDGRAIFGLRITCE